MKLRKMTEPLCNAGGKHHTKKDGTGPDVGASTQSGALPRWYLLKGREVVPCTLEEMMDAGGGFQTLLQSVYRGILIRTVFVAVDYAGEDYEPFLFETVVVGGTLDGFTTRRATLLDAELTHREVFDEVVRLDSILCWTMRAMKLQVHAQLQHLRRIAGSSASANDAQHTPHDDD